MNHKRINETLFRLIVLNNKVEWKKEERVNALHFNSKTVLGNEISIMDINDQLQELELEFKRKTREL